MTSPSMPCCAKTLLSLPPKVFFECSGQAFFCNGALVMPCGIACQRRLIRMDIQLFFPDQLRTNLLCFLLEGSVICFQKLHRRPRGSGFEFRLRSRSFPKRCWYRSRRRFFRCWQWCFHPRGPAEAVRLRGRRLDAVDAVLRVETGVGGFSLDFSPRRKRVSVPRRRLHRSRRLNPERMLLLPAPGCSRRHLRLCSHSSSPTEIRISIGRCGVLVSMRWRTAS